MVVAIAFRDWDIVWWTFLSSRHQIWAKYPWLQVKEIFWLDIWLYLTWLLCSTTIHRVSRNFGAHQTINRSDSHKTHFPGSCQPLPTLCTEPVSPLPPFQPTLVHLSSSIRAISERIPSYNHRETKFWMPMTALTQPTLGILQRHFIAYGQFYGLTSPSISTNMLIKKGLCIPKLDSTIENRVHIASTKVITESGKSTSRRNRYKNFIRFRAKAWSEFFRDIKSKELSWKNFHFAELKKGAKSPQWWKEDNTDDTIVT